MIDHRTVYREEAVELLGQLEASLLELENTPDDTELVASVFRALHTIKGSGAMFGFDDIAGFTHEIETVFDDVRAGRIPVTPELVGITLAARDHIGVLLHAGEGTDGSDSAAAGILERLRRVALPSLSDTTREEVASGTAPAPAENRIGGPISYRLRFAPASDIFLTGTNPLLLFRELRRLGEFSLIAQLDRIPELDAFDGEQCYTYWDAVLTTTAGEDAVRDVFIFVEDCAQLTIQAISAGREEQRARLGELLVERGDIAREEAEKLIGNRPRVGEILVQAGLVSEDRVHAALLEQQHLDSLREKRVKAEAATSLRVPAAKLDSLVNIVGELVTVQARLSSYALGSGDSEIAFIAGEVERLAELLRDSTMSVRMLPIGETFRRLKRLVRDLSSELGKKVELTTEGDETELDKTVVEQLADPLVHLIRNAIDHGIETPDVRVARGKPAGGRIHLSAAHAGAFVLVKISDNGFGLDRVAIRARAIEKGLIDAGAELTEKDIDALILAPGFSTAPRVTGISGRGVGMDVVRRQLDSLRGFLSIASTTGQGTTVTLKIPLTLAIIDGLLVEAGGASFVVPLSNVLECIELSERGGASGRRALVTVRGELVPYIVLRERFAIPGDPPHIEQVIIADTRLGKCGFVVDRVIGDHHTVIKNLGSLYRHVDEVSGATILGDGTVALILDVDKVAAAEETSTRGKLPTAGLKPMGG